jgi:hypothetical protein
MCGDDNKRASIYLYEIDMIDLAGQHEVALDVLRHLFARRRT